MCSVCRLILEEFNAFIQQSLIGFTIVCYTALVSFIFVSPVYTVKHILHIKYISKSTTATLKEL